MTGETMNCGMPLDSKAMSYGLHKRTIYNIYMRVIEAYLDHGHSGSWRNQDVMSRAARMRAGQQGMTMGIIKRSMANTLLNIIIIMPK